ncbi:hypothetical protein LOC67_08255 [Stieleria sp. JC731]|uniref:SH3 domain-containing protein n=1 Tax=Pirellulaceae TaxID=2691357 RepID=UPI001E53F3F2|nr:hypothetical protein [Stieleria sp. JC731]MCC9600550.1 hypothetical protein [Stieleria sp. JC731]
MSTKGANSPVIEAGRDAVIGPYTPNRPAPPDPSPHNPTHDTAPQKESVIGGRSMVSSGDNSPVVVAGRDAVINLASTKPDFITDHDGAGALLMTQPDFRAFISGALSSKNDKIIGRIVNGTPVAKIELLDGDPEQPSPPWAKVTVLDGDLKGQTGWILMTSLRVPN